MLTVRIILVALIAISIALVPIAGGAVVSIESIEMSVPDQADMPCCAPDDCKASMACAVKCFNFIGVVIPAMVLLPTVVTAAPPFFAQGALHEHVRSPPTHPPPDLTALRT